ALQAALVGGAIFCAAHAAKAAATTPEACATLRTHGKTAEAHACYESLSQQRDPYLRAEGYWGLKMYRQANDQFRQAVAQSDANPLYRVRWGRLLHERFNNTDADNLFKEALQRDPKNAQAYLGLALVSADGFDNAAIDWDAKALALDSNLVEAHELMANLALEDSATDAAVKEADAAIALSGEALDAMAIHAAVEVLADRPPDAWFDKIRSVNPHDGEAYALVAHHLILNRRYEDGIVYYRKAIELDPEDWSAHSELGINLMRLGQEDEPRRELELSYANDYRDAATVNSLRLLDSYKNFVTFKDGTLTLKLQKKEADLLHPYVEAVAKKAMATYEAKYKFKLPGPVQVEVYPDHEDFAVRTLGMPGLGALGVTFGEVVAMDSPSGRKPGDFNWASTLWHEMSHVYILTMTNHRVPRWFAEGLAVHEETQASPEWGDRVTPEILLAIRDKKLLPIRDLDRGFVRPEYEAQVIVSYYQAGQICDYIQSRWGSDKLLEMAHSFAKVQPTADVIQQDLGVSAADFDKQFLAWLAGNVGKTAANFDDWRKSLKELAEAAQEHHNDDVIQQGQRVRDLYPDYVYDANAYEFLAQAYEAEGNKKAAAAVLTEYEKRGGHDPDTLKELASLEDGLGNPADAAATLNRLNDIYPSDEQLHRRLGDLWLAQNNYPGAIREYSSVVAMHPMDEASAHLNLAQAYLAAGQTDKAKENVLETLEAAPDYRPAQKLLLQLEDDNKGK
ncbi:MAG: tetratricopeptide repeat protein, partial [Candidatus Acidiferrales bacterium]